MDANTLIKTVEFKEELAELTGRKKSEDNWSCFPKLTFKQRLTGFVVCLGIGYLLNILSFLMMIFTKGKSRMIRFGIFYSVGNLISLFATGFLVGPVKQ